MESEIFTTSVDLLIPLTTVLAIQTIENSAQLAPEKRQSPAKQAVGVVHVVVQCEYAVVERKMCGVLAVGHPVDASAFGVLHCATSIFVRHFEPAVI